MTRRLRTPIPTRFLNHTLYSNQETTIASRSRWSRARFAAIAAMGVAPLCALAAADIEYCVIELVGLEGATFNAHAINESGAVTGVIDSDIAFVWDDGVITRFPDQSNQSIGTDLNETGRVIGMFREDLNVRRAFFWTPARRYFQLLPIPVNADPVAVNNQFLIVGRETEEQQAWVYDIARDEFEFLKFGETTNPPGINEAIAVNDDGVVAGTMMNDNFSPQGFTWTRDGGVVRLEQGAGAESRANGMAENGVLVVGYHRNEFFEKRVALWSDGALIDLGVSDPQRFFESEALDVNDARQIIGFSPNDIIGRNFGWIWEAGEFRDMNDLIESRDGIDIDRPFDINGRGDILATTLFDPQSRRVRPIILRRTTLHTDAPTPGIAGERNMISASGITPGEPAIFMAGFGRGVTTDIPGCPGLATDIIQPQLIGTATADANGDASLTRFVPQGASGRTVLFQIIDRSNCTTSNIVDHRFP